LSGSHRCCSCFVIDKLVYYSEGALDEPVFDLINLNRILEKIIEAMKMRAVTHHGASVEVAKK
jgi:hypothetical protein